MISIDNVLPPGFLPFISNMGATVDVRMTVLLAIVYALSLTILLLATWDPNHRMTGRSRRI